MSDEYASSGFQGSLVNPCPFLVLSFPASGEFLTPCHAAAISDILPPRERETYPPSSDYATKNYPPPGDSTFPPPHIPMNALVLKAVGLHVAQRHRQVADGLILDLNQIVCWLASKRRAAPARTCTDSCAKRNRGVIRPRRALTRAKRQPKHLRTVTAPHARSCTGRVAEVSMLANEPSSVLSSTVYSKETGMGSFKSSALHLFLVFRHPLHLIWMPLS